MEGQGEGSLPSQSVHHG